MDLSGIILYVYLSFNWAKNLRYLVLFIFLILAFIMDLGFMLYLHLTFYLFLRFFLNVLTFFTAILQKIYMSFLVLLTNRLLLIFYFALILLFCLAFILLIIDLMFYLLDIFVKILYLKLYPISNLSYEKMRLNLALLY